MYRAGVIKDDIIFVGTSRTKRMIDIKEIERVLAQENCATSAYNFGLANMTYEEMSFVLDLLVHDKTPTPSMVVFEEPLGSFRFWNQIPTKRVAYFSDWDNTVLRLKNIYSFQETLPKKLYRASIAMAAYVYYVIDPGKISAALFPKKDMDETDNENLDFIINEKGYLSLDETHDEPDAHKARQRLLENQDAFQLKLHNATQIQLPKDYTEASKKRARLLKEIIERLQDKNIQVAFYTPPQPDRLLGNNTLNNALEDVTSEVLFLNYNNPRAVADLWSIENWFDAYHLNAHGSKMLSADIAKRLASSYCEEAQ